MIIVDFYLQVVLLYDCGGNGHPIGVQLDTGYLGSAGV